MQDGREPLPPSLKITRRVTHAHGERFAQKWREMQTGELRTEAFAKAGVIAWPEGPNGELTPAQERLQRIEDEIVDRTFDAAMSAVSEAFVKVARDVLARERRIQMRARNRAFVRLCSALFGQLVTGRASN